MREPLDKIDVAHRSFDAWEVVLYIMALSFTLEGVSCLLSQNTRLDTYFARLAKGTHLSSSPVSMSANSVVAFQTPAIRHLVASVYVLEYCCSHHGHTSLDCVHLPCFGNAGDGRAWRVLEAA